MQEYEGKTFGYINPLRPRKGLFSRIMKRLGLERKLKEVKECLSFFVVASAFFVVILATGLIALKHILSQSSLGVFLSLIFSDPKMVIKYGDSFIFSVLESMPENTIFVVLISLALFLLLGRSVILYFEKLLSITKSIQKQNYGHK